MTVNLHTLAEPYHQRLWSHACRRSRLSVSSRSDEKEGREVGQREKMMGRLWRGACVASAYSVTHACVHVEREVCDRVCCSFFLRFEPVQL